MAPAQRRRKRGTGTIRYKKGREKPWETSFSIGKDEYRYDYFATDTEARAHLDRLTAERDDAHAPRNIVGGSQRVDTFLVAFLNRKAPHIKAKTLADYTYQCGLAGEYLGTMRVDEVTRTTADAMLLYYHRRGYQNGDQLRKPCDTVCSVGDTLPIPTALFHDDIGGMYAIEQNPASNHCAPIVQFFHYRSFFVPVMQRPALAGRVGSEGRLGGASKRAST